MEVLRYIQGTSNKLELHCMAMCRDLVLGLNERKRLLEIQQYNRQCGNVVIYRKTFEYYIFLEIWGSMCRQESMSCVFLVFFSRNTVDACTAMEL